jgi:hypothetical protein
MLPVEDKEVGVKSGMLGKTTGPLSDVDAMPATPIF